MKRQDRLWALAPGQSARVLGMSLQGAMRRRLRDMGIVEGGEIACLMRSPFGDPAAYRVCGAVIALRREDGEQVQIELEGGERNGSEALRPGG